MEQIQLFSEHMSKLSAAEQLARQQAAHEGGDEADDADLNALLGDMEPADGKKTAAAAAKKKKKGKIEKAEEKAVTAADPTFEGNVEHKIRLSKVLEKFVQLSRMDGRYHLCEHQSMLQISNWLHPIPLTIAERYVLYPAL